jgi:hypothetical protein
MPRDEAPSILEQQLFNLPPAVLESIVQKVVDAKAADSAAPTPKNSNSMSAFEQAAEARMATKAALDAAYKADVAKVYAANPVIDEQTKIAGAKAAIAAAEKAGIPTVAKPETAAERLERIRLEREKTQSGANPDNPKPTEDPGPGMYWANFGGVWRKYKSPTPGDKVLKFGDPGYVLKPGDPGYVAPEGDGDDVTPKAPVGTPPAYVYNPVSKTWEMPPKPTGAGNWVFDANNGWVNTTVNPGSSGMATGETKTLAIDTFRNTLALLFGAKEASQPWVTALYTSASKFYNSGSTVDEAINLSLQDVRYNKDLKPFTDRFKGIYALTDRLAGGEAIEVPTVADYFKSESAMGDVLRAAGMGELATQDFLGGVIGLGKSVLEVTNLITDTFDRIDNAPAALKADLQAAFPGADRTSIAKAMLTGKEGAAELTKKVKAITVQSAAKTQGVTIDALTSQDIAAQGYDYNKSLTGFATVKQTAERGATLGRMSGIDLTQQEAIASAFGSSAAADEKIRKITEEEKNRFAGRSGLMSSSLRGKSTNTII